MQYVNSIKQSKSYHYNYILSYNCENKPITTVDENTSTSIGFLQYMTHNVCTSQIFVRYITINLIKKMIRLLFHNTCLTWLLARMYSCTSGGRLHPSLGSRSGSIANSDAFFRKRYICFYRTLHIYAVILKWLHILINFPFGICLCIGLDGYIGFRIGYNIPANITGPHLSTTNNRERPPKFASLTLDLCYRLTAWTR